MRILVVEDEHKVAKAIKEGLEDEGFEVELAHSGDEAFTAITTGKFDLVVLDVMLPGRNGLEVLSSIRTHGVPTPVLVLSARDSAADRIKGLQSGANDYLTKPFAFVELLARILALIRRTPATSPLGGIVAD
jgi:two-component system, OmpR family, copper resistance phosphate regulon response regulator CusR